LVLRIFGGIMAISRLAISNPGATTDTLLHTATRSSLASIIATNKANTVAEVRVWIVPQGQDATPANWSYIAYDADITATNSLETFRFPVMAGDKIYVRSTTADVSFQIMGIYETGADTYVYAQPNEPTAPQVGDIWVDTASDIPSIDNTTVYRWSKTSVGGETSLSGTGNDLSILKYIAGYEQVYLNGVLLAKDLDYFATNGTSITDLTALSAGDIVEVISPYAIELTDVYTKSVSDSKYATAADFPAGAWIAYTPTWSGISSTGGVSTGRYTKIGKTVHYWARYVVGSSSISIGSSINPSLPLPKAGGAWTFSHGWIDDSGSGWSMPFMINGGAYASNAGGTYTGAAFMSNTIPFTWAVNDAITIAGTYEAA
jgi:hypothetical protein